MSTTNFQIHFMATLGLLALSACGNPSNKVAINPDTSASTSQAVKTPSLRTNSEPSSTITHPETASPQSHGGQGGQVVETGSYHLELVVGKEPAGTHIDFFLQKGDNHDPIPSAEVKAQIQLPDGSNKAFDMAYDADGKHYFTFLPGNIPGEYKVVVLSEIDGKKVNGRFRFQR